MELIRDSKLTCISYNNLLKKLELMMSSSEQARKKVDEYAIKELIGKGSFGEVEKC